MKILELILLPKLRVSIPERILIPGTNPIFKLILIPEPIPILELILIPHLILTAESESVLKLKSAPEPESESISESESASELIQKTESESSSYDSKFPSLFKTTSDTSDNTRVLTCWPYWTFPAISYRRLNEALPLQPQNRQPFALILP